MRNRTISLALAALVLLGARNVIAHCDTIAGPVVGDARTALATGDATPVLKWVDPADEREVRAALRKTLAVRVTSDGARELADQWFFETVVRLHRTSENEPFTGVKTTAVAEPLAQADASIGSGDAGDLIEDLTRRTTSLLRTRFTAVRDARAHANESVEAGRRYVAAYVSFMRLVEELTGGGEYVHAQH